MSKEDVLLFGNYGMRSSGKSYYEKLKEKDKEIERLNNILDKINKLYDCDTHCENIYHAIGVVLNKKYCDIDDVWEKDLRKIIKGVDKE